MNTLNGKDLLLQMAYVDDNARFCPSKLCNKLRKWRCNLLWGVSVVAYLATVAGFGNNIVYICLAASATVIAWPAIKVHRAFYAALIILLLAMFYGATANGVVGSIRSATPYFGLIVAFALLAQGSASSKGGGAYGIWLLYGAGLIQLATYLVQVVTSADYYFFYSLDEFHRYGLGWISIISFFHASLPMSKKRGLPRALRVLSCIFWLVPLLALLNSSRSELLITALLVGISIYIRWGASFVLVLTLASALLSLSSLSGRITGVERVSNSMEEVFTTDFYSISDAYTNYRAFENLMMIERIFTNGPFGCGLGCEVPLEATITLNDQDYDEVAVFHNGYLTAVLHFGLAGVALIVVLAWKLFRVWKNFKRACLRRDNAGGVVVQQEALRFAVLLVLFGTGLTTGGFMSSYDVLVLLLPLSSAIGFKKGGFVRGGGGTMSLEARSGAAT